MSVSFDFVAAHVLSMLIVMRVPRTAVVVPA
jgi:hypothetical protein